MSHFKPEPEEREMLKKAVAKYAHDPFKTRLLSDLERADSEFAHHGDDWEKLKLCAEQYFLHAQTEVRRDPTRKSAKTLLTKADSLARKFHPNFS